MARKKAPATPTRTKVKNPFALAAIVSDLVQIQDVRVVECQVKQGDSSRADGSQDFKATNKVEVEFLTDLDAERIIVLPRFLFHQRDENATEDQGGLTIECLFALTYSAPGVADLPKINIKAFAHINGVFNAWPYWREFAQNMAARMGLPKLLIPVFRFNDPPGREAK